MRNAREASIEQAVRLKCKEHELLTYKLEARSITGFPDRVIIHPAGWVVFLELKTDKGKVSERQKRIHSDLRAYGQTVIVTHGRAEAEAVVAAIAQLPAKSPTAVHSVLSGALVETWIRQNAPRNMANGG